jgi:hypothetical protein
MGITELFVLAFTAFWTYVVMTGIGRLWRGELRGRAALNAVLPQTKQSMARLSRTAPAIMVSSLLFMLLASAVIISAAAPGGGWLHLLIALLLSVFLLTFAVTLTVYFLGAPRWAIPPTLRGGDERTHEGKDM